MLNSGEVPNLFAADEYEAIITHVRPHAKEHGIAEGDRCVHIQDTVDLLTLTRTLFMLEG